jgi:hypothetical protein
MYLKTVIATAALVIPALASLSQNFEEYDIEQFYQKIDLESGTLDQDGQPIDFIFVETELKQGQYEIEIADGPDDLYEIKGTDYYLKFKFYYGYAGYGEEGILDVGTSAWSSTFYKRE